MVLDLGHNTQPQGIPTITLRKLGRERLGLHSQSLRQRHLRTEEHGYQHKKPRNGFSSRHRDRHRPGPKIRNTDSDTSGRREKLAWQWWKPGHDYSQRDGVDSGTILRAMRRYFFLTNRGTYSTGRHPSPHPGTRSDPFRAGQRFNAMGSAAQVRPAKSIVAVDFDLSRTPNSNSLDYQLPRTSRCLLGFFPFRIASG
jgi:hypothetical protein